MIRRITLLIMIIIAFVLLNYYILRRTGDLWGYKPHSGFYILLSYCCFSYLITSIMERFIPSGPTALLHTLSGMWLGIGIISLTCLAVYDLTSLIITLNPLVFRWVILCFVILLSAYGIANAWTLRVKTINIDADIKIVQLSDIHIGSVSNKHIKRIIRKTNAKKPDVVLITGDLVDTHTRLDDEILAILDEIEPPVYFISGNHERYTGYNNVTKRLKNTNIQILENESVFLKDVQITGISDHEDDEILKNRIEEIEVDNSAYSILMLHRPLHLEAASRKGIDLMLSGHTHNGQIVPFNYLVKMRYKKIHGLFHHENCKMYVTTGTGTWGPKMRLGSTNEIVVFEPAG